MVATVNVENIISNFMKNKTQTKWVKEYLRKHGEITRNYALSQYWSRLAAIIADLKEEGWEFECFYRKTEHGKDYVYKATKTIAPTLFDD